MPIDMDTLDFLSTLVLRIVASAALSAYTISKMKSEE